MTYIPDLRDRTDELSENKREYIAGYRRAQEQLLDAIDDKLDDEELYSIEREIIGRLLEELRALADINEIEEVCALFESEETCEEC